VRRRLGSSPVAGAREALSFVLGELLRVVSGCCGVQRVLASADPRHRYDDPVNWLGNVLLLSPR
jgi:hypothetical protein